MGLCAMTAARRYRDHDALRVTRRSSGRSKRRGGNLGLGAPLLLVGGHGDAGPGQELP